MNKLNVGEFSKKKTQSHSVVLLDEHSLTSFEAVGTQYAVLDLPNKIVVTDAYIVVEDVAASGTVTISLSEDGVTPTTALGVATDLTVAAITSLATSLPLYYETGCYVLINFGTAVPSDCKAFAVVEYLEIDKANGELTNVPVREALT